MYSFRYKCGEIFGFEMGFFYWGWYKMLHIVSDLTLSIFNSVKKL